MTKTKKYALVSAQGTACSEAVLSEKEFANMHLRLKIEKDFCLGEPDDPVTGSWTDVTDNDAC